MISTGPKVVTLAPSITNLLTQLIIMTATITTTQVNDGNHLSIYSKDGMLTFDPTDDNGNYSLPLASKDDYEKGDRCVGSVFEALEPDEHIKLEDGYFVLDDELDLVQDWSIV